MSKKSFSKLEQVYDFIYISQKEIFTKVLLDLITEHFLSALRFQCFLVSFVVADGTKDEYSLTRGFNANKFYSLTKKIIIRQ